ncbi:MAG: hypothetical protein ACOCUH_02870 [Bacteriovoracia bacterium]
MAEQTIDETLQDIRTIIHGLKMADLSFVEQDALNEINLMIKDLPNPEELPNIAESPGSVKQLKSYIGQIMHLIEVYGSRNAEYEARYRATTGLPPRYKVLKWRCAMGKRELKNNLIKDFVKLSSEADDQGYEKLAEILLDCGRQVQHNINPIDGFHKGVVEFITSGVNYNRLRKQSQALTSIDFDLDEVKDGLKQVNNWFDHILNFLKDKSVYLYDNPKTEKFIDDFAGIYRNLAQLSSSTKEQISQINESTSEVEEKMEKELTPQSVSINGKPRKIEWMDDPDDPGWQMAVVNIDGKYYKIQENDNRSKFLEPIRQNVQKGISEGDYVFNQRGNPYRIISVEEDGSVIGAALNMGGKKFRLSPQNLTSMAEEDRTRWVGESDVSQSVGHGERPTDASVETIQNGQTPALQQLGRRELSTLIQRYVPEVWQQGYAGKSINQLSNEEMQQVIKENTGAKSLPSLIQEVQKAALSNIFNLKKHNVVSQKTNVVRTCQIK